MTPAGQAQGHPNFHYEKSTLSWKPTCACNAGEPIPCTVLDPFAGSGTTGEVAKRLGRNFILIELKQEYVEELIKPRIESLEPLFAEQTNSS